MHKYTHAHISTETRASLHTDRKREILTTIEVLLRVIISIRLPVDLSFYATNIDLLADREINKSYGGLLLP